MHGWAVAQRIHQLSKDVLRVDQGALYPALPRKKVLHGLNGEIDPVLMFQ